MKEVKCVHCDHGNLVSDISERFECGECKNVNYGIDIDTLYSDYVHLNKMYSDLADRVRARDREVERLTKLLIDNKIETDYDMELCVQNEEIKILEEAVGFYAENNTWLCGHDFQFGDLINHEDLEENSPITKRRFVGGKRARQALEKLKEIRKKK